MVRTKPALVLIVDVTIPFPAIGGDGDDRAAFNVAVMCYREAAVDALFDVHDFQDVDQFVESDFAHNFLRGSGHWTGELVSSVFDARAARGDRRYKVEG